MKEGLLKVLVTRSDPVTGAAVTTVEQTMPQMALTGTPAERRYMERKWLERLRQAMRRVQKRKSHATVLMVEQAAKRQCKKDERQTEALLAKVNDWQAHVFDTRSVESVTRQATLVKECLKESRSLAQRKGETLTWLECLLSRTGGRKKSIYNQKKTYKAIK